MKVLYEGTKTDIDHGGKPADQYGFLTNNMLYTLKIHGNILVSVKRYNTVLNNICEKKYNQTIDIGKKTEVTDRERVLIGKCHKELIDELIRLTGFKSFSIRRSESTTNDEAPCLIFERNIEGYGDTDGDQ